MRRYVERSRVLVSAHRGGETELVGSGHPADLLDAIDRSARVGADYLELDIRLTRDDVFVVSHDAEVGRPGAQVRIRSTSWEDVHAVAPDVVEADPVLAAVAATDARLQVDCKVPPAHAEHLVELLLSHLPASRLLLTTGRRKTLRTMRDALTARGAVGALLGMTIGSSTRGLGRCAKVRRRWGELFPDRILASSGADVVVVHELLAAVRLTRWAARRDVPLVVWTVDEPRRLCRLMRDPRVWMVITNYPARAVSMRDATT